MSDLSPKAKHFTQQSQSTQPDIMYQRETLTSLRNAVSDKNNSQQHLILKSATSNKTKNPFKELRDKRDLPQIQSDYTTNSNRSKNFQVKAQHQPRQFQLLRLSLKEWRQRRAPNPDQIVSVCYGIKKPEVRNCKKNSRKLFSIKKVNNKQSEQHLNSDTDDMDDDSSYQIRAQVIKKLKTSQKAIKKQESHPRGQTKFRESTNSHLRREKEFQDKMWENVIEQRFFYDSGKYRYEDQEIAQKILQAEETCKHFQEYAILTAEVRDQPHFSRCKDADQFQKSVNEKRCALFPRVSNIGITFF